MLMFHLLQEENQGKEEEREAEIHRLRNPTCECAGGPGLAERLGLRGGDCPGSKGQWSGRGEVKVG